MTQSLEQILTSILGAAYQFFQQIGFWPVLLVMYLLGSYLFWRWSMIAQKNKNSVFDIWTAATIVMIAWSRITYIIANSASFINLPWTIFPYERYGDQIYLFRTLPWKFVSIWDGGYLFSGLAIGFLFFVANYIVFVKKWRWRDMYKPVMMALHFMFSGVLVVYGILLQSDRITLLSLGMMIIFFAYLIQDKLFSRTGKINYWGILVFSITVTALEGYTFLSSQITDIDKVNIFVLLAYTSFVSVMYTIDVFKRDTQQSFVVPTIKAKNVATNKPIKIKTRLPI